MKTESAFRHLLRLFRNRFFENDTISPQGGFEGNVWQVLGMLATPGFLLALFLLPLFFELAMRKPGPAVESELRGPRVLFSAYAFSVSAFITVFEWDTLFPDRRDFLILASFPIRLRDLFFAKIAALCLFMTAITVAVNLLPTILISLFSADIPQVRAVGLVNTVAAQIGSTWIASAFGFFAVAAVQGVLINLLSPRMFRRVSAWVQMLGMSAAIMCLLLFPVYAELLMPAVRQHARWVWYLPPVWFTGIYELVSPWPDPVFHAFGIHALRMLAISIGVFFGAWALGFRRHYRRTLETEDTSSRIPAVTALERFIHSPQQRAIFVFTGKTLMRSAGHRLFIAAYLSAGLCFGLLFTVEVVHGKLHLATSGLRAFPFFIAFFVISGFRAAFQFPAELPANWLFRMTESEWGVARRATRARTIVSGLVPALLLFLPLEIFMNGWATGLFDTVFQFVPGALLAELLFYGFDKVPFTCTYFPGNMNVGLLAAIYFFGFTTYSFRMAEVEQWRYAPLFWVAGGIALTQLWHADFSSDTMRFDAYESQITKLDLT